nr:hypothetical protein [Tanacetum cinerariifolium]
MEFCQRWASDITLIAIQASSDRTRGYFLSHKLEELYKQNRAAPSLEKQVTVESSTTATGQTCLHPTALKHALMVLDAEVVAGEVEGVEEVAMAATE